jgi:ATP-dependent Clp protease ATP-binding subunit ClpA
LAKAVAEFLFGDENHMLRLDMSEFMEEHSVSKLIGSPPGYRDHEEGGQLTERIRSDPYTVVLLDEVEKADPKILDIFLQVFDEGVLTDSRGRKCNFRETVIFLTSNLGVADAATRQIGFGNKPDEGRSEQDSILNAVTKSFRPEFINRLSQIIVFRPLSKATVRQIVDKLIDRLKSRLAAQEIKITLEDSAYELLMSRGFSQSYGAREIERTIDTLLSKPLAKALLQEKIGPGATLKVSGTAGQISFLPAV